MTRPARPRRGAAALAVVLALLTPGLLRPAVARAQAGPEAAAVQRGVAYLRGQVGSLQVGEAAMVALALHKAEVPDSDPALATCIAKVLARFGPEGYVPELQGGHEVYEAAVVCMLLVNLDPYGYKPQIEAITNWLIQRQKSNGSWDYIQRVAPEQGDCSMSQYALLGLWEAENAGYAVHPSVWDRAARFFLSVQYPNGGWNYHPDEASTYQVNVSMTAAGVGSVMICNRQLAQYRKGSEVLNPLMVPLVVEGSGQLNYKPATTTASMNQAARRGIAWLNQAYNPGNLTVMGNSVYYGLYGLERVQALADKDFLGSVDFYPKGLQYVLSSQTAEGNWRSKDQNLKDAPTTAWAILFAARSTAKSVRKIEIRKLGAGTLLGGRGLPTDLNNLTIAQGRVVVRPMNGAVDSMLAVLEDPATMNADSALAGLVARYQSDGPPALRPFKARFRKLKTDRDPGIRKVACWALARCGDLDTAPELIRSLLDPVDEVVSEARVGLQVLSRKLDTLGPPRGATAEQKLAAARRWRDWYESVRPPDLEPLDDAFLAPARAATAPNATPNPNPNPTPTTAGAEAQNR